ncbi:MAG: glycosyltransferase family 4 protein [Pirellulales bacterium]
MRILAVYRHYWPDSTPYARILRTILEHLSAAGHQTAVFTAQPGYNGVRHLQQPWRETLGGVDVRRMQLLSKWKRWRVARALDWAYFLLWAVMHAVAGQKYDLIITNSHPPILMGCALRLIRKLRGTPYIYHCQDLHPESAAQAGDLGRSWLYRLLLRWDTSACRNAQRVVVLSQDMAESLEQRGLATANVSVINNPPLSVDSATQPILPSPLDETTDAVRFLFAGNLGRFQSLDRLVAAAHVVPEHVCFQLIFMGEGDAKHALIAQAGNLLGRRIIFVPHQPVETALAAMRECDFGVVSLLAEVYRYAYPSKSMMYLSAGCPLLALIEPESELSRTVEQHELGYVAASHSIADIAEAMVRAVGESGRWTPQRRDSVAQTCQRIFGQSQMLAAWDRIIAGELPGTTAGEHGDRATQAA